MSAQAEIAFAKTYINTLASQQVTYKDDYQQAPENTLRKVPILPVDLPPAPASKAEDVPSTSQISLTFKSLKPPASFTLSVQTTDSIAFIKSQLASQPKAPPADIQRLLIKGKALADNKLLKEYTVNDGDTVNLMLKPGSHWDPNNAQTQSTTSPSSMEVDSPPLPVPSPGLSATQPKGRGHSRIPSVVLSPSPSVDGEVGPVDIELSLDAPNPSSSDGQTPYHASLAKPEFWAKLHTFLSAEFVTESDTLLAFEDFLRASKNTLSASEIAKIRDYVGVAGMAGT